MGGVLGLKAGHFRLETPTGIHNSFLPDFSFFLQVTHHLFLVFSKLFKERRPLHRLRLFDFLHLGRWRIGLLVSQGRGEARRDALVGRGEEEGRVGQRLGSFLQLIALLHQVQMERCKDLQKMSLVGLVGLKRFWISTEMPKCA